MLEEKGTKALTKGPKMKTKKEEGLPIFTPIDAPHTINT